MSLYCCSHLPRPKPKLYEDCEDDLKAKVKLLLNGPSPKKDAPWTAEKEPTGVVATYAI